MSKPTPPSSKKTGPTSQRVTSGKPPQKRHDWEAIKRAFVEGVIDDGKLVYPGPSKLFELFGAPRTKISERSNREGWETERALRQRGVQAAADVQKASILAAEEAMESDARRRAYAEGVAVQDPVQDLPPVAYASEASADPKPVQPDTVRRTLDSATVALATTMAAFDAKAVKIAEGAMAVGAKLLLGKETKGEDGKPPPRTPLSPKEYREVVDGIRIAHGMGRLALGQTTENQGHGGLDGGPLKVDSNVSVNDGNHGTGDLTPAELARLYAEEIRARPADGDGQTSSGNHGGAPRQ